MESWKSDFYKKYSAWFGRRNEVVSFKEYFPYGKKLISLAFPVDKQAIVVEMGCGTGGFVYVFQQSGYKNASGVDYSIESVAVATQNNVNNVKQGDLVQTLADMQDESVDVLLYLDVLEHFHREEVLQILSKSFNKLKKQGKLIIHVPNAEAIFGSRIRYADITHEAAYTASSMGQMLRYAGFRNFNSFEDKPVIHTFLSLMRSLLWRIMTIPFRLLHAAETGSFRVILSQNMLVIATKP